MQRVKEVPGVRGCKGKGGDAIRVICLNSFDLVADKIICFVFLVLFCVSV